MSAARTLFNCPEAADRAAGIERLEARLFAGLPARQAARELEQFARALWRDAGLGPWPEPWRVQWADLRARRDEHGRPSAGLCAHGLNVILLDASAHHAFTFRGDEFVRTLLHEFAHVMHPDDGHGPAFAATVRRLVDRVLPDEAAPPRPARYLEPGAALAAARPLRAPAPGLQHPERIVTGMRPCRGGWRVTAGLDKDLEYRG